LITLQYSKVVTLSERAIDPLCPASPGGVCAHLDERGIIKHSTKVRIVQDRTGRRAARVASKLK